MTTSILRYVSIGSAVAMAGVATADTIYMQSASDGSIAFCSPPDAPRYAVYAKPKAATRVRRTRMMLPGDDSCNGALCDKSHIDGLIDDVAQVYGVESALLHAVVTVESRYNPSARGPNGAGGLMQLLPGTAKRYGVENVFDPEQNLRGGAKYLHDLLEKFGNDMHLAVAAYQAGELNVLRYKAIPPFRSTLDYVARVLGYYNKFRMGTEH